MFIMQRNWDKIKNGANNDVGLYFINISSVIVLANLSKGISGETIR